MVSETVHLVGLGSVWVGWDGWAGAEGSLREAESGCCRGADCHGSGCQLWGEAAVIAELARSKVVDTSQPLCFNKEQKRRVASLSLRPEIC